MQAPSNHQALMQFVRDLGFSSFTCHPAPSSGTSKYFIAQASGRVGRVRDVSGVGLTHCAAWVNLAELAERLVQEECRETMKTLERSIQRLSGMPPTERVPTNVSRTLVDEGEDVDFELRYFKE